MAMEMPKGLPFSVDTWSPNSVWKRHHFLTHAHKDHFHGILSHASFPIFCTHLTKLFLLIYHPQLDERLFVEIEVGKTVVIDDPDDEFSVTAFDANHCPGAVMFLFEGRFGNILHTGDCRLIPEVLQALPEKYVGKKGRKPSCPLDFIFLDCTFGGSSFKMPGRQSAIQQVINCIWKHPSAATVYLTCDLLGQEEVLLHVSKTFGCKIYVDKEKYPEYFQVLQLIAPEVLTGDSSSRFQLFDGFPKLYERAEAKIAEANANFQPEPLIVRPSAQWYVCEEGFSESKSKIKSKSKRSDQAIRDVFGVWHVCYSMHSSREELEWALQLLAPRWIISTAPSCRATELEYARKNCFNSRNSGDSLSRLLDIPFVGPSTLDSELDSIGCSPVAGAILTSPVKTNARLSEESTTYRRFGLSPDSKPPSVTLFGRARLGIQHSLFEIDCKTRPEAIYSLRKTTEIVADVKSQETSEEVSLETIESSVEFEHQKKSEMQIGAVEQMMGSSKKMKYSSNGDTKKLDDNLRRLYRSMNVSVPQPLPSLLKIMNETKYTKRRF